MLLDWIILFTVSLKKQFILFSPISKYARYPAKLWQNSFVIQVGYDVSTNQVPFLLPYPPPPPPPQPTYIHTRTHTHSQSHSHVTVQKESHEVEVVTCRCNCKITLLTEPTLKHHDFVAIFSMDRFLCLITNTICCTIGGTSLSEVQLSTWSFHWRTFVHNRTYSNIICEWYRGHVLHLQCSHWTRIKFLSYLLLSDSGKILQQEAFVCYRECYHGPCVRAVYVGPCDSSASWLCRLEKHF